MWEAERANPENLLDDRSSPGYPRLGDLAMFNLLEQPWIPCRLPDGSVRELSVTAALSNAHQIASLADPSPLVTVALTRLLLAIVHRAYLGPKDSREWLSIWDAGRFESATLAAYLDRWHHRFELYGTPEPFAQAVDVADERLHPPSWIVLEAANGNNPTLFDHRSDRLPQPLPPGEAARQLLAYQAYAIGFGKSTPFYLHDGPMVRGFAVLVQGENLFETLALNLVDVGRPEMDLPWWEREEARPPVREGTIPGGPADAYTWLSRRVLLQVDSDRVTGCRVAQGLVVGEAFRDPMKAYRRGNRWVPINLDPEREVWRHADALFSLPNPDQEVVQQPDVLTRLAARRREAGLARRLARPLRSQYRVGVYGLVMEPGKAAHVLSWRAEELPLPLALLEDPDLVDRLKDDLVHAEEASQALGGALRQFATMLLATDSDLKAGRKADPDEVRSLSRHLDVRSAFWAGLARDFAVYLSSLPEDPEAASARWTGRLQHRARDVFNRFLDTLEPTATVLKAGVAARALLGARLASVGQQ